MGVLVLKWIFLKRVRDSCRIYLSKGPEMHNIAGRLTNLSISIVDLDFVTLFSLIIIKLDT